MKRNNWKLVQGNLESINKGTKSTEEKQNNSIDEKQSNWKKVRQEYVGKSKVIVNDVNMNAEAETKADLNKMSFFNVVKEAAATEKRKKERPSLMKFLEKFDSVELPESETPIPSQGFSFFEADPEGDDEDTRILKNGIQLTSGTIRELATPTYTVKYFNPS